MSSMPIPPAQAAKPRRPVLHWLRCRLNGWLLRHQLSFNFALHMVGIPLAFMGLFLLLAIPLSGELLPWQWAVAALGLGYLLQWIGHCFEGNDLGEWAAIKRLVGLPYVGIAPRWNPEDPSRL